MNRNTMLVVSVTLFSLLTVVASSCNSTPKTTNPTTQTTSGNQLTSTTSTTPAPTTTTTTPPTNTTLAPTTTTTRPTTTKPVVTTPPIKVIFADDFNSETTGANPSKWTVNEPTGTDVSIDDTIYFGTSGKSAKLQDNSPTETWTMNKVIGSQTARFGYEISIRLSQTNQITGGVYIGNSTFPGGRYSIENLGVSIAFWSDGYIKYNDDDNNLLAWKNIQTYDVDKWYMVKALVDIPNQKFNLYIDNVLKLTDVKFRYPMTSLDQISVAGRNELPTATIWIDNVLVTEAP